MCQEANPEQLVCMVHGAVCLQATYETQSGIKAPQQKPLYSEATEFQAAAMQ